jgi:hypothetical protein
VYLPALAVMALASVSMAPFGARGAPSAGTDAEENLRRDALLSGSVHAVH